jgi:hypothetical protein
MRFPWFPCFDDVEIVRIGSVTVLNEPTEFVDRQVLLAREKASVLVLQPDPEAMKKRHHLNIGMQNGKIVVLHSWHLWIHGFQWEVPRHDARNCNQ